MDNTTFELLDQVTARAQAILARGDHVVMVGAPASIPYERIEAAVKTMCDAFARNQGVLIQPIPADVEPAVVGAAVQATLGQLKKG